MLGREPVGPRFGHVIRKPLIISLEIDDVDWKHAMVPETRVYLDIGFVEDLVHHVSRPAYVVFLFLLALVPNVMWWVVAGPD